MATKPRLRNVENETVEPARASLSLKLKKDRHAQELMGAVIPEARWRDLIERIAGIAEGDGPFAVEAAQWLMACAFGTPTEEVVGADD